MKQLLAVLVAAVILLHQDIWNWTNRTLVFGLLPAGLAYHAGYSVAAALTMALLVRYLWPAHLDEDENPDAYAAPAATVTEGTAR
jgi:hypothetical protein